MKKAVDVMSRIPYKCKNVIEKKWREKDKKTLFERVKERFNLIRKLRINIIKVDPNKRKRHNNQNMKNVIKNKRRKITDSSEIKLINEHASIDNESSMISSNAVSKVKNQKKVYYKLASPAFPPEPDWSITLSRNDFPWYDVKFDDYSAQECFDMYRKIITDEDIFNRKVRKEKNATINKYMKEYKKLKRPYTKSKCSPNVYK